MLAIGFDLAQLHSLLIELIALTITVQTQRGVIEKDNALVQFKRTLQPDFDQTQGIVTTRH